MASAPLSSCAFLDRDGTIIVERHYLGDPNQVRLERGAAEGLRLLKSRGFLLIVVSNQSGIGRGLLTIDQVASVNTRTEALLASEGVHIDDWYMCPHSPDFPCECRKPKPGMVHQAIREHTIDVTRSIVIGDKEADIVLAQECGMMGYLVLTGHGPRHAEWARSRGVGTAGSILEIASMLTDSSPLPRPSGPQ